MPASNSTASIQQQLDSEAQKWASTLLQGQVVRTVSLDMATRIMLDLAKSVATIVEHNVLMSLLTSDDVAELFGVTARRIRARAKWLNERGHPVGWQVPGTSQWLFRPAELEMLRPGLPGRPREE